MAKQDSKANALKVVTGKVRLCYPNLFKARAQDKEDKPQFSVEILIPKADTATYDKIRAAQNAAANSERGKKALGDTVPVWGGDKPLNPTKWVDTLRDGDDEDEHADHPERKGHWFISARSGETRRPGVVDKNRVQVEDQSKVYGGVFGRVSMSAFPFNTPKGAKGVSFGLDSVMVLGYGEAFGAPREDAAAAFDDEFEDTDAPEDADDDLI